MINHYHIDYETYSACDITLGAYRYANDPSTRILFCAVAKNDGQIFLWDSKDPLKTESMDALRLLGEMVADNDALIYSHNAQFEIAISRYHFLKTFGMLPPILERWRCTAAMCRRAAIPWSLKGAAEYLRLTAKMSSGQALIQIFSLPSGPEGPGQRKKKAKPAGPLPVGLKAIAAKKKPMPDPAAEPKVMVDGARMTIPEAWKLFGAYCKNDVQVERELQGKLSAFEMSGLTLAGFQFDIRMNDLGVPLNIKALKHGKNLVEQLLYEINGEYNALTCLVPSQTAESFKWLRANGYLGDDLTGETMENQFNSILWGSSDAAVVTKARRVLELRMLYSHAAVKKIPAMVASACDDDRIRGTLLYSGALRTHRWSGRLIQPQNFKRGNQPVAYDMICKGCGIEDFKTLWDNPVETLASAIRHFIQEPDCDILDADFANIEARITPWLCGDDMLDEFRAGEDVYITMAAEIFSVPVAEVTKEQRFVGKQTVLAAQYGVSWKKFKLMCAMYGRDLDDRTCQLAVFKYRKKRHKIVQAWRDYQNAAVNAMDEPGKTFSVNDKVHFTYGNIGGFTALTIRLPSKHLLVYPDPEVKVIETTTEVMKEDEKTGEITLVPTTFTTSQISFYGPLTESVKWGRVYTHGSKFLENICQGVGGDFMTHGAIHAEKAGYDIFMVVHDQALASYRPALGHSPAAFEKAMCTLPSWAKDFPLEASCKINPYYTKNE